MHYLCRALRKKHYRGNQGKMTQAKALRRKIRLNVNQVIDICLFIAYNDYSRDHELRRAHADHFQRPSEGYNA